MCKNRAFVTISQMYYYLMVHNNNIQMYTTESAAILLSTFQEVASVVIYLYKDTSYLGKIDWPDFTCNLCINMIISINYKLLFWNFPLFCH
jgi:hypothetical protein